MAESPQDKPARELLARFVRAQRQYAEVYREILNVNPVYRTLAQPSFAVADLTALRRQVLGRNKVLLVYHVGRRGAYLFLLSGRASAEAFPLTVPTAWRSGQPPLRPAPPVKCWPAVAGWS